jgi:hypothetical protein
VLALAVRGPEPDRDHPPVASAGLIVLDDRRHRRIGLQPTLAEPRAKFPVAPDHRDGALELCACGSGRKPDSLTCNLSASRRLPSAKTVRSLV